MSENSSLLGMVCGDGQDTDPTVPSERGMGQFVMLVRLHFYGVKPIWGKIWGLEFSQNPGNRSSKLDLLISQATASRLVTWILPSSTYTDSQNLIRAKDISIKCHSEEPSQRSKFHHIFSSKLTKHLPYRQVSILHLWKVTSNLSPLPLSTLPLFEGPAQYGSILYS